MHFIIMNYVRTMQKQSYISKSSHAQLYAVLIKGLCSCFITQWFGWVWKRDKLFKSGLLDSKYIRYRWEYREWGWWAYLTSTILKWNKIVPYAKYWSFMVKGFFTSLALEIAGKLASALQSSPLKSMEWFLVIDIHPFKTDKLLLLFSVKSRCWPVMR